MDVQIISPVTYYKEQQEAARLTAQRNQTMRTMYDDGHTLEEICHIVKCTEASVINTLVPHLWTVGNGKGDKYSLGDLGKKFNRSRERIRQLLNKHGITERYGKHQAKRLWEEQIYGEAVNIVKDKYRHGATVKQAAEDVGVPLAIVEKLWTKTQDDENANRRARLYALTKEDENGCLIWQGNFGANGQPRFNAGGQSLAMYHTYWHEFGKFPRKGMKRSCKNGKCVNPRHLK